MTTIETAIIGSGPAGLAAAAFGPPGALVIEARKSPGWKILISANGRCNVTNTFSPPEFLGRITRGARQLKFALGAFPPDAVRSWLAELGCPTVVRGEWEVYPKSNSAQNVLNALLSAAGARGAEILCDARVTAVAKHSGHFAVETRQGEIHCMRLIVASGTPAWGRPQPELDQALRQLGHTVRPWVPGLSPIPLKDNPFDGLDGISFTGSLAAGGNAFEAGEMLLTDKELSGPGALIPSASIFRRMYDGAGDDFMIDFLPSQSRSETLQKLLDSRKEKGRRSVASVLGDFLPKRLAARLALLARLQDVAASQLTRIDAERLTDLLHAFPCRAAGMPSLAKGFVASGGIPFEEVDPKTMESKIVPGLFFAGEILDYDAPTGGFNITLALATGRLAGFHLSRDMR